MKGRKNFVTGGVIVLFMLFGFLGQGLTDERYTVKPGDSLYEIAKTFGISVDALKRANQLQGDQIKPKQILWVPGQAENRTEEAWGQSSVETDSYVVKRGETLHGIAKKVGIPVEEIRKMNQLRTTALQTGQKLILKKSKSPGEDEEELGDAGAVTDLSTSERSDVSQTAAQPLGKWNSSEERNLLIKVAKTFLGVPYRLGGSTLKGLDCSAFVKKIYEIFDIHLPRTAREQFCVGRSVNKDELEEGDLVFFKTRRPHADHVGIYIGSGEFVHASSRQREVKVDHLDAPYFDKRFLRGVRVKELGEI